MTSTKFFYGKSLSWLSKVFGVIKLYVGPFSGATTLSITTLSITALSIMILGLATPSITLKMFHTL